MKTALLAGMCVLLSACQVTTFEKAPVTGAACDPRLSGHWQAIGDTPSDDGDVQLDIGRDCQLDLSDRHEGAMRAGDATRLHTGKLGAHDYLWVDSAWALKRFDSDLLAKPGDIVLLRYAVEADRLTMHATDDKAIAHRILDEQIPGDTRKDDEGLQNRITGGPHPQLLDSAGFFAAQAMRFRRSGRADRQ